MRLPTRHRRPAWTSALLPTGIVAASVFTAVLSAVSGPAGAQDAGGADLYVANCAACHQTGGEGIDGAFPPLAGNPAAADADYVTDVIVNGLSGPIEVLGTNYDAAMPPVAGLSDDQVAAIAAHVVDLANGTAGDDGDDSVDDGDGDGDGDDAAADTPPPDAAAPTEGDVDRGHDLFIGSNRLDEGGSACSSCHSAGKVGDFGGQMLGPDLTDVYDRFGGEAGMTAWLGNPGSETMRPIFADRPMTEGEIADLVAFLADAPDQDRPNDSVDWLLLAGLAGLIVLLAGMAVAWRGMRQTYVSTLTNRRTAR